MAETIRQVDYYYITTPNRAGEAARALTALKKVLAVPPPGSDERKEVAG